jgi:ATP phosphoribosyltransferase regulatory subunit
MIFGGNMKKNNKTTPEGTKDFLFEECLTKRSIEKTVSGVFASRGFNEVITPGFEFYDVFDPDLSGIKQESMYKMTDKSGRIVVMRPDLTLPIARLTATRLQNLPKPIRLYYTQPVYRNCPGLSGRRDETTQAGAELLGAGGIRADLEMISTAVAALGGCLPGFRLELGHAGIFRALADRLPVSDDVREDIRVYIETKNYAALDALLNGLEKSETVSAIRKLPHLFGGEDVFEKAAFLGGDSELSPMLNYLHKIYGLISELGFPGRLMVDLGLVQRNSYYTNIVFSAYVEGFGDAVLFGGRYDSLLAYFGSPMPAIGFAVNIDDISEILIRRKMAPGVRPADVLVHGADGYEVNALNHAGSLAKKGLKCENSVFAGEDEAVAYAKACGIKRVDIVSKKIKTVVCCQ